MEKLRVKRADPFLAIPMGIDAHLKASAQSSVRARAAFRCIARWSKVKAFDIDGVAKCVLAEQVGDASNASAVVRAEVDNLSRSPPIDLYRNICGNGFKSLESLLKPRVNEYRLVILNMLALVPRHVEFGALHFANRRDCPLKSVE